MGNATKGLGASGTSTRSHSNGGAGRLYWKRCPGFMVTAETNAEDLIRSYWFKEDFTKPTA